MNTKEQIESIIKVSKELELGGISLLLYKGDGLDLVTPEEADNYSVFIIDEGKIYRGTIPKKKLFTSELIFERIDKQEKREKINYSKIFEHLKTEGLRFYSTSYGISIEVIFRAKTIDNEIEKIRKYLLEKEIEFKEKFSDAHWVYQFHISKKQSNLDKIKSL